MLRDTMAQLNLVHYPEIAMLIFLAVFLAVVYRVLTWRDRSAVDAISRLPLDDGAVAADLGEAETRAREVSR